MTLRLIFGLGWSLVTGLAGGWLVLAPWALGEQGAGDWTTVTRNEVASGLGLIALAGLGLVVVLVHVIGALREAGVIVSPRPGRAEAGGATSPEMEKALIALAQALAEDLESQRTPTSPAASARAGAAGDAGSPTWREQG